MKRSNSVLFVMFMGLSLTACKKGNKNQTPSAITGKWQIQKYTISSYVNGVAGTSTVTPDGWFTANDYYQLNPDGSAIESQADPAIAPMPFDFSVSGSKIIVSHELTLLGNDTCSYAMPTSNQLVLKTDVTEFSTTGNIYRVIQEVDLSK